MKVGQEIGLETLERNIHHRYVIGATL